MAWTRAFCGASLLLGCWGRASILHIRYSKHRGVVEELGHAEDSKLGPISAVGFKSQVGSKPQSAP